ncbi:MAG TPA: SH3 domain-containing protein [Cryptosporangiaceae bacterium]|nr:SH3 domain-containing protein [Cryptosporangiaceae bacterium]
MRKLPAVLVVLLLLSMLPGPITGPRGATAQIAPDSTATVTERLNLRSGPSLSDSVVTVMPAGATVTLSGQEIGDYVFLTWGREKGWAHRSWLDIRPPATTADTAITTDRLNLRASPSLSDRVITIMPAGATVTLTGQSANGYASVTYNGQAGWAFAAYLGGAAPPTTPTGTAVTTANLNLRDGPSLNDRVVVTMPVGAVVTLTGETQNGYRSVTWSGYSGWAHPDWLDVRTAPAPQPQPQPEPQPTSTAVATDSLNLRAGPATSFRVLTLIPRGARVVLTGETQNGYRSVSYEGTTGWAHGDWLVPEGAAPPPVSTTTAITTDRLNLRAGPATSYAVLVVMPQGATVTLTGQSNNGFLSASWSGYTGWAFEGFLDDGTDAAPPVQPPAPAPTPPPAGGEEAPFDVTNSIVGPVRGSADEAIAFARAAGAQRMDQVELYIREVHRVAPQVGFDPAIIVAQSALETGYWKSSWWVQRLNPAGLGVTGDPGQNAASPTFANGTIAAHAQLAHMHAEVFGRSQPLPEILQGKDPTYQQVFAAGWAGTIRTIEDLAGTWAVDPEYHFKIVRVAREIFE